MTQKTMEKAKKLFEIHMTAEEVKQITGLTEKEVAKLKNRKIRLETIKKKIQD